MKPSKYRNLFSNMREFIHRFFKSDNKISQWTWTAHIVIWLFGASLCLLYFVNTVTGGFLLVILFFLYWNWFFKKIPQLLEQFYYHFLIILILAYTLFNLGIHWSLLAGENFDNMNFFSLFFSLSGMLIGILLLTFFLYQGAGRKFNPVVLAFVYGFVWINFNISEHFFIQIIFLLLLAGSLLKSTRWLEMLKRNHLYIVSGILLILLAFYLKLDTYLFVFNQEIEAKNTLWKILLFFDILYKVFLLTVLTKIPIVLVYHHALLSRKLKISGLFQSTVPQIIQFFVLAFIFYFIAGKIQANVLEQQLEEYLNENSQMVSLDQLRKLEIDSDRIGHEKSGGWIFVDTLDNNIRLFWVRIEESDSAQKKFKVTQLDTLTLQRISKKITLVNGNSINIALISPDKWHQFYSKIIFGDKNSEWIFSPFITKQNSESIFTFNRSESGNFKIPVARLYSRHRIPGEKKLFLVFDLYWVGNWEFWNNPFLKTLGFMLLTIFLVNLLIVNKVTRLGDAIVKNILEKFEILKKGIREISIGNLDYYIAMRGADEFTEFAGYFNQMSQKLRENLEILKEKERLNNEMEIARKVQQRLLPELQETNLPLQIAAETIPATEVGGDFYDVVYKSDSQIMVTVGDVSGKGTSAAFYMAQFLSVWRQSAVEQSDITIIAQKLNAYFSQYLTEKQVFITSVLASVNPQTGEVSWVRAGHVRPLLYRHAEDCLSWQESKGVGIGLVKNKTLFESMIETKDMQLENGDWLLFVTDGVLEAYIEDNDSAKFWDEKQVESILTGIRTETPNKIIHAIKNNLLHFYGSEPLKDDSTLLIIKYQK